MNSDRECHARHRGFSLAFWKKKKRFNHEDSDCVTEFYTAIDTMVKLSLNYLCVCNNNSTSVTEPFRF